MEAVRAIRAWLRLSDAFEAFNRALAAEYGVTGAQLALLRMIAERGGQVPLAALRASLAMHPATLGQLVDRLVARAFLVAHPDPDDRRRRIVALTDAGRRLIAEAPVAGPVRLRQAAADPADPAADPARLQRLADAFDDAITLFGLEEYTDDRPDRPAENRPRPGG